MSISAVPIDTMPHPSPSRQGFTHPVAPLGFAWRPLRVVPALHRDHYWVASEHTVGQWYQVYLAILDAAHATCACPQATYRLNRPDAALCKHQQQVVEHILDEPAPLCEPEPEPATAPETSGSVMDVFRHKRAIADAIRADKVLPFRVPPVRLCTHCGVKPAMPYGPECSDCNLPG